MPACVPTSAKASRASLPFLYSLSPNSLKAVFSFWRRRGGSNRAIAQAIETVRGDCFGARVRADERKSESGESPFSLFPQSKQPSGCFFFWQTSAKASLRCRIFFRITKIQQTTDSRLFAAFLIKYSCAYIPSAKHPRFF